MNARAWFEWNGIRCEEFGLRAIEVPIVLPKERVQYKTVVGRSGDAVITQGREVLEEIVLSVTCRTMGRVTSALLSQLAHVFRGSGSLRLSTRPEGCYIGRVNNQLTFKQVIQGYTPREVTIDFKVKPYICLNATADINLPLGSGTVTNAGTLEAYPRIEIHGSGDVAVMIGASQIVLTNLTDGIVIDSEKMDALNLEESQLMNDHMSGDFPTLPLGTSTVSWAAYDGNDNAGGVTSIVITPRWRVR